MRKDSEGPSSREGKESRGRNAVNSTISYESEALLSKTRATHEGVLVTSGQAEPELLVVLHRSRDFESNEVEPASCALVDQNLSRLHLPGARRRAVEVSDHAPDRVRWRVSVEVGPEDRPVLLERCRVEHKCGIGQGN